MNIFISVFLISLSMLSYEILLMRIFSVISWSHFAYMVISIALLGFGVSGTFISLLQERLKRRFYQFFSLFAFLFSLSLPLCFALSQRIPFSPFLIVWYSREYLHLLEYYLVFLIPFFLGATCIGLSFLKFHQKIPRIYFVNLLGSGAGTMGAVLAMYVLPPLSILGVITILAFLSALLSAFSLSKKAFITATAVFLVPVLFLLLYLPQPRISQYKGLSVALKLPQAEILSQRFSPLGRLDVVRSPAIRYAPGLSLNFKGKIPPQLALFIDADSMCAITDFRGDLSNLRYLDYLTSALPYHLLNEPSVLILGAGGGSEVLCALYHNASSIKAVEVNPQVIDLVKEEYGEFSHHLYSHPRVSVKIAEGRGFLEATDEKYDLIQISLLDSFSASAAGVYASSESYLYTIEAIKKYIEHLTPQGILSITRWVKTPPRDGIKLFATAVESLEDLGVKDPSSHLIFIRSWATSTLLVARSAFIPSQIERVKKFTEERLFDLIWYPGIRSEETNRYNILAWPYYYEAAQKILSEEREKFYEDYLFYIRPATDNRPYFFHFFKWKSLPYLLRTMGRAWIPFMEWGYVILIATLVQAIGASILLVILPLFFLKKRATSRDKLRVFIYFLLLGMGYMFMEISFIQKFTLFLFYPIYSVAVVICGFLIFSGWGSYLSERIHFKRMSTIEVAIGGIVTISLIYLIWLKEIFASFIWLPDWLKISLSLLLIAPLAFLMGMPFPSGLRRVSSNAPSLIPWAWGINGCSSVISAVLAIILAISGGFNLVIGISLASYTLAAVSFIHYYYIPSGLKI
ncbi:SAM-dependent methyltransferase [Candidatus Aerophobetes bacterium]|nr:SAM-dependent methyltransferase [Candidatus Aerophobetes bacterium]